MDFRVIPTVTLSQTPIALPSYGTLANTAPVPSQQQLSVAAANAPIRYTYGTDRLGLQIINALLDSSGNLLLDCLIGEGTIGGVTSVEVNDETAAGVTVTAYDGTQTTANSELVAAWALQGIVYADVRPGIAYCVIKIAVATDVSIDERSLVTLVQGLKVYDPRQNLFLRSNTRAHASWIKNGSPTVVDGLTDSFGQPTVSKITSSGAFDQSLQQARNTGVALANRTFLISVTLWTDTGQPTNNFQLFLFDGTVTFIYVIGTLVLTTTPTRYSFLATFAAGASNTTLNARFDAPDTWAINSYFYCQNPQVEELTGLVQATYGYVATGATVVTPVTQYSNNPALALADFLADPVQGYGDTVDWNSVGIAAARCDEQLGGAARHTCKITFDRQIAKKDIEETLRGAAGCFVVREGGTTYLVPDMPVDLTTTTHLQAADWATESLRYSQRDAGRAPNRIAVRYTNTAVKPWGEAYTDYIESADVTAGLVDAVEMVVNATWITSYAEAMRLRNRYFAEHQLGLKGLEFEVFEKGWKIRRGDVIRLSNNVDLVQKAVRVQSIRSLGFAKLKIIAQEYQPAMYSDDTPAAPTVPSSSLPNPRTVLPVTALTMTEEVYLDQSQSAAIASGAKYLSRFRIRWTASADRYLRDNVLRFMNGVTPIFEGPSIGTEYVSPPVQQGQGYSVEVRARNVLGFLSAIESKSATALGKGLKPGPVPAITQAIEIGGEVLLAWEPAPDIDVIRYEWRYTPNSIAGSWETADLIDRVDGLRTRFKGLPVGTHRFYVKPIDSVPQYSDDAVYADITVTSDSDAFLQDYEFSEPVTLFKMIEYWLEGERHPRWITDASSDWDTTFPSAMSTYTDPIATYGTGSSPYFESETIDLGSVLAGTFTLTPNAVNYGAGPANVYFINTSDDNITFTPHVGLTYTGAARYVNVKMNISGFGGAGEITAPPKLSLAVVARKESAGPVTSNASGATTISLAGQYAKAVRITVTPRGTVSRNYTVDDVTLTLSGANSFDVYLFDQAGTQVASDFDWSFEGI